MLEENYGKPVDIVIVCTGAASAIKQSFGSIDRGGTILFFAPTEKGVEIPIHVDELWINEVTLTTSYGAIKKDLEKAVELIQNGKINVKNMITHRLGLSETERGFKIFTCAEDSIKVIINPHTRDCLE